jgi:hypothetical protein
MAMVNCNVNGAPLGHNWTIPLLLYGFLLVLASLLAFKTTREVLRMWRSGIASPVFDWRRLLGYRYEYHRARRPVIFFIQLFWNGLFAIALIVISVMVIGFGALFTANCLRL